MSTTTREVIQCLEESLWRAETRFDADYMNQVLADDFCEFGSSGRTYNRSEILPSGRASPDINARLPLPEFTMHQLAAEIVHVRYISEIQTCEGIERSNRSSIWQRGERGWRIRFHQGTPTG